MASCLLTALATPRHTRDSMHNQHLMRIIRITLNSEDIQLDPYEKSVGDAELDPVYQNLQEKY